MAKTDDACLLLMGSLCCLFFSLLVSERNVQVCGNNRERSVYRRRNYRYGGHLLLIFHLDKKNVMLVLCVEFTFSTHTGEQELPVQKDVSPAV